MCAHTCTQKHTQAHTHTQLKIEIDLYKKKKFCFLDGNRNKKLYLNYIIVLLWILCNESTYMTYTLVNTEKAAQKNMRGKPRAEVFGHKS